MAFSSSTKRPQVLQITPAHEIVLKGPFDHVVTSYLELSNPTEDRVCFKVKTTAPRRYCVRPNSGLIKPAEKIKIAIMLQPVENDSQSERNRHKFMVQSIIVKDENMSVDNIWTFAEQDDIMDSKLRCVFQMPSVSEDSESSALSTSAVGTKPTAQAAATTTTTTTTPTTNQLASTPIKSSPSSPTTSKVQNEPSKQEMYASNTFSDLTQQSNDGGRHSMASNILPRDDTVLLSLMVLVGIIGIILGKYII